MDISLVIKNGRVVDGTGRPSFAADIGIAGDRIAHVGEIEGAADVPSVDARGQVVCPGFIEIHTHYDPQLCWDRTASPAGEHGVTTVVTGNCSLSLAPVRRGQGGRLTRLFNRIEDLSPAFFEQAVPYTWETFGDYLEVMRAGLGLNVGATVGHSTLRHYVMGEDAQRRTATESELVEMCEYLAQALEAGAFGLSMTYDHVHDDKDQPVASSFADLRERIALAKTVARHGRKFVQCNIHPIDTGRRNRQFEELARISLESGVSCSALGIMENPVTPNQWAPELEKLAQWHQRGARVFAESQVRPADLTFRLSKAWIVAFYMPTWAKIMVQPVAERIKSFSDRSLRPQLSKESEIFQALIPLIHVRRVISTANNRYLGRNLADIARDERKSMIDALLDIALEDGLEAEFDWRDAVHADVHIVGMLLSHPMIKVGASDAGAHISQMAGEGDSTYMLEHFVRKHGKLSLERAVRRMTGDLAEDFGLPHRGVIAKGCFADIVIFDPDTVARSSETMIDDVPGGGGRYIRRAVGIDKVLVNGTIFVNGGRYMEARSGRFV